MSMEVPLPLVALLGASALWCTVMWVAYLWAESHKTELEIRKERIDEEARRALREPLTQRLRAKLAGYGWDGALSPLLVTLVFVYMLCGVLLTFVGVQGPVAVILALPFSTLVGMAFATSVRNRRQRAFNLQLVQALDLFAANLKAGVGVNSAIESVLPSLPEPLRGELGRAMSQHQAGGRRLSDAVAAVAARYPSSAMHKFVAVLRIDEDRGGEMAAALEEAANSVRRDTELEAEALAEIAQERMQFFGIVGIIALIALYMYTGSGAESQKALRSPLGLTVMFVMACNFAFGVFRTLRTFAKARGGL